MIKTKVIVVEDEPILANEIKETLLEFGYDVPAVVGSGLESIQASREFHPDLVLMDVQIKGDIDGIETAQILNSQLNIPVVFLTSYSDELTLKRATNSDSYGLVTKPYRGKELFIATEFTLFKHSKVKETQEEFFRVQNIFQHISIPIIAIDKDDLIYYLNPLAESILGVQANEIRFQRIEHLLEISDFEELKNSSTTQICRDILIKNKVGTRIDIQKIPLLKLNGKQNGMIFTITRDS